MVSGARKSRPNEATPNHRRSVLALGPLRPRSRPPRARPQALRQRPPLGLTDRHSLGPLGRFAGGTLGGGARLGADRPPPLSVAVTTSADASPAALLGVAAYPPRRWARPLSWRDDAWVWPQGGSTMTSVVDSCSSTMTVLPREAAATPSQSCDRPPTRWAMDRAGRGRPRKPGLLPERFARGRVTGQEPAAALVGGQWIGHPSSCVVQGPCASRVTKVERAARGQSPPAVRSGCRRAYGRCGAARPSEVSHEGSAAAAADIVTTAERVSKVFMPVLNIRFTGASAASR